MNYRLYHPDEAGMLETFKNHQPDAKLEGLYEALKVKEPMLEAVKRHFEARGMKASKGTQMLILAMGDGAIGISVRYIDFIWDWVKATSKTDEITIDDFEHKIFPDKLIPILSERELKNSTSFFYKGYEIRKSMGNGRGYNGTQKTSSYHVCEPCGEGAHIVKKQFSFTVVNAISKEKALEKAKKYIDALCLQKS